MKIAALLVGTALFGATATPVFAENWTHSNFDGLSIGLYGAGTHPCDCISFGGIAGYGMGFNDNFYVGGEVQAGVVDSGASFEGFALGKLGVTPVEDVLIYGTAGVGYYYGSQVWAAGGGADVKLNDNFGAGAQVIGLNFGGGFSEIRFSANIKFYLDDGEDG